MFGAQCMRPIAYVEAEHFGGIGTQAHALISGSDADARVIVSEDAINDGLGWLHVQACGDKDGFDTIGLGRHRETDLRTVGGVQ